MPIKIMKIQAKNVQLPMKISRVILFLIVFCNLIPLLNSQNPYDVYVRNTPKSITPRSLSWAKECTDFSNPARTTKIPNKIVINVKILRNNDIL